VVGLDPIAERHGWTRLPPPDTLWTMASRKSIQINRAPVLTLWAAVVAERLGHHHDAALTYGRTVAGLNAASKARGLGLAEPEKKTKTSRKAPRAEGKKIEVTLLGRNFQAVETEEGWRALAGARAVTPESVERYLESKFGDDLAAVEKVMIALARSRPPRRLADEAYALYERFRPAVPRSVRGWGALGELDLELIRSLAKE
jgi:hypothetical protein